MKMVSYATVVHRFHRLSCLVAGESYNLSLIEPFHSFYSIHRLIHFDPDFNMYNNFIEKKIGLKS